MHLKRYFSNQGIPATIFPKNITVILLPWKHKTQIDKLLPGQYETMILKAIVIKCLKI